jgi:hypothetical protein
VRVLKNGVLNRIFVLKGEEVTQRWRKLHNEELHNLYSFPNIRMIKSKGTRLVEYVAHMEEKGTVHNVW